MSTNIQKLYIFGFLYSLSFFGAISVPFFLDWGRLNYTQIFLIQLWFSFWLFVLEVPTGVLADKIGRKMTLVLSAFTASLAALLYGILPNIYLFLLAELIFAIGMALRSGADKAILYDTLIEMKKSKEAKYFFSRYALSQNLGFIVAFPVGSLIAGSQILPYPNTLPLTFLLTAIPLFLSAFISFTLHEPKRKAQKENLLSSSINSMKQLMKRSVLRSFAIDMALISATTFFIFWFYQPLLLNANLNIGYLGFASAGYMILGTALLFRINVVEQIFGMKKLLFLTALIPAIAFAVLVITRNVWVVLICVYVIAIGKMLREPLFDHFMNIYIKSKDRASVLSAINMLQRTIIAILYPIVGFLSDISVYHAVGLIGLLTFVFAIVGKVDESHLEN